MLLCGLDDLGYLGEIHGGIHLLVLVNDFAVFPDNKSPPGGRVVPEQGDCLSVDGALNFSTWAHGHAEGLGDRAALVGQEREVEFLGNLEVLQGFDMVSTDPNHNGIQFFQPGSAIPVTAGLLCAATGHGGRVEVDDDVCAAEMVGRLPFFSRIIQGCECGGLFTDVQGEQGVRQCEGNQRDG